MKQAKMPIKVREGMVRQVQMTMAKRVLEDPSLVGNAYTLIGKAAEEAIDLFDQVTALALEKLEAGTFEVGRFTIVVAEKERG